MSEAVETKPIEIASIDNYIEIYHATGEWIRFADAKAAVVLTVAGALGGLLIPNLKTVLDANPNGHLFPGWLTITLGFFGLYILFTVICGIAAFRCITPFRKRGLHPALDHCKHFHGAATVPCYPDTDVERFTLNAEQIGIEGLRREVIAGFFFDAHISGSKYAKVFTAIRMFAISTVFGFLFFISAQL